jgi:sugar lactone lactonase YvrE
VTACAFGGAGLTTLFITTAREGTDPARHPEAGHLFAVETGSPGRPEPRFTPC